MLVKCKKQKGKIRIIITFLVLLIIAGVLVFFLKNQISEKFLGAKKEAPALVGEVRERIFAPPPLIVETKPSNSFLTRPGVFKWTNIQRQNYGLPPLKESAELNASADLKIKDMLSKQYFAHISPDGKSVGDLAKEVGYKFIAVGENLALGNFESDEKLVQAWMDSPGHRKNILSPQYKEMGVAVLQGEFQGRKMWLSVQHFAKPLSACRQPSEALRSKIAENQTQIEKMYLVLSNLESEIKSSARSRSSEYRQKVKEYNLLVSEYNELLDETKLLIDKYNSQVKLFNACAQQ